MNARNFVDYTSDRSHCESRMREICTYGLTRRRARPVRPSLLYWFPALRRQERVCGRGSTVPCGSQHGDGLEELEPTHRNDATPAPRRSLGLATIVPLDAG